MDREEKLRAAKEKLKKFQKKRQERSSSGTPEPRQDQPPVQSLNGKIGECEEKEPDASSQPPEEDERMQVTRKHASLSEQIAGVLSSGHDDDDGGETDELKRRVQHQSDAISELQVRCKLLSDKLEASEAKLVEERKAFEVELAEERDVLAQRLKSQTESIEILVTEKTDLDRLLAKVQMVAAAKDDEIMKLKAAIEESSSLSSSSAAAAADAPLVIPDETALLHQEEVAGLRQEVEELSSRCVSKEGEVSELRSQLSNVRSKLEMAELNLTQIRSASDASTDEGQQQKEEEMERLVKENAEHVERVKELTSYIQKAAEDREQIIRQYTSYSQQLTAQIESLTAELNEAKVANHGLACREADLVAHVQRLEEQLQQLMALQQQQHQQQQQQQEADSRDESVGGERVAELEERARSLEDSLKEAQGLNDSVLAEKKEEEAKFKELAGKLLLAQEQLSDAETRLEMERTKGGMDVGKQESLVAACQSDKVAASRAMTQNVNLKRQIEELEVAVIQTTNSKASLASELESLKRREQLRAESEKNTAQELNGLRDAVNERDRSIGQLKEQINYYINFAENSINGHLDGNPRNAEAEHEEQVDALIQDLLKAKETIGRLTSQKSGRSEEADLLRKQLDEANGHVRSLNSLNSELRSQLEVLSMRTTESSGTPLSINGETAATEIAAADIAEAESSTTTATSSPSLSPQHSTPAGASNPLDSSVPPLSPEVASLKLERKFREAMMRNVELANEKERLEHIVVQLQDETDTVGEYVTIYQHQRKQQKLRLLEKERQLQTLSMEREMLKSKLGQLESVIKAFVQEKTRGEQHLPSSNSCETAAENGSAVMSPTSGMPGPDVPRAESRASRTVAETDEQAAKTTASGAGSKASYHTAPPEGAMPETGGDTADKILALISEIGSNQILGDNGFHPWFWEHSRGKLMTV